MSRPKALDLFCGAGGVTVGLQRAGFEVWGIDVVASPRYPGDHFTQADVFELEPWFLSAFDFVWASPPCQAYSVATRDKSKHPDLVGPTRELLEATGLPYVIENVPGAPLRSPVVICGSSLGLKVRRHRLFESNCPLMVPPCAHGQQGQPVGVYGGGTGKGQKRGRKVMSSAEALEVMEMPWANRAEATQAIPPAYAELIGAQALQAISHRSAA